MNTFSVYYQVYDSQLQTEKILQSFRNVYPEVYLRLVCDGGSDHTKLANRYDCHYIHSSYHMGLWDHQNVMVKKGKHCVGWNKEEAMIFLERMFTFAQHTNTTYILPIEDDIYITNTINIINQNFEFTQVYPGNQLSGEFIEFCKKFNPDHTVNCYGCCSGNFMNRQLYLRCVCICYDFIKDYYDELFRADGRIGWPDTLNNLVFNLCGYTGIENPDYHEGFDNPLKKPIFHSYVGRKEKWANVYANITK